MTEDAPIRPPWLDRPYLIAEAGVNHNGDPELAHKLVDAAHAAGADAVKFQTWLPGEQIGRFAAKVAYLEQAVPGESFFDMGERLRLPFEAFVELKRHCDRLGIEFLSTADGQASLDFLVDDLDVPFVKIGSTELNHPQYLAAAGAKRRPVILSTGLGDLAEVAAAVEVLRAAGGENLPIVVLQCTSEYPAPDDEMNLRAMCVFASALGLPVGLSDHSRGAEASIAAVAMGGRVIEKHFTLDRNLEGPDHAASLEPGELAALATSVRRVFSMLGDGLKRPTRAERANITGIRRSVVAVRPIAQGEVLRREDLACKRPGTGIAPGDLERVVGLRVNRALEEDEPIDWADLRACRP